MRKKLPLGIQNFHDIREDGYYYVDKTSYIHRLVESGKYYFLSRPRRFGKSLLVDTLQELFEGNEKLFKGLFIHDKWDWTKKHPVIKISFSDGVLKSRKELDQKLEEILSKCAQQFGIVYHVDSISGKFRDLICDVQAIVGEQIVILIDEYDKPILDNIENPDIALEMREGLKNFYSVIKGADAYLKFVFLTGVSKFSKVSLFSGLNNLRDITIDKEYGAICGYTENDLDAVFSPELEGVDRDQVRSWYNGYNWRGESVYNPFDLLLFFTNREFRSYWFETGTPTFLIKSLFSRKTFLPELGQMLTDSFLLSTMDVGNMPTEALLFQTGYLTIHDEQQMFGEYQYRLGYPNQEVYQSLNNVFLKEWIGSQQGLTKEKNALWKSLHECNFDGLKNQIYALYAGIPYEWHIKNNIAEYEGYYASVFYAFFASLGLDIICEESSHAGRLDMAIKLEKCVYLFEFKILENAKEGSALAQIKNKGYADKYCADAKKIYLIGIEFSKEKRQIQHFQWEQL